MIPRRAGGATSGLEQLVQPALPPIPVGESAMKDAEPIKAIPWKGAPDEPKQSNTANPMAQLFVVLSKFVVVCKTNAVSKDDFDTLVKKGLVVSYGDFAVCSQKGLTYLVDFEIVA